MRSANNRPNKFYLHTPNPNADSYKRIQREADLNEADRMEWGVRGEEDLVVWTGYDICRQSLFKLGFRHLTSMFIASIHCADFVLLILSPVFAYCCIRSFLLLFGGLLTTAPVYAFRD